LIAANSACNLSAGVRDVTSFEETGISTLGTSRRSFLAMAASAALAGISLGAMSSDTTNAFRAAQTFDPTLICGPKTVAELQARAARRIQSQSRREP
jgi:hypothetical protein